MFSLDYKCCTETESKWFGAFVCSRIFPHLPSTGKALKLLIIPHFAVFRLWLFSCAELKAKNLVKFNKSRAILREAYLLEISLQRLN